MSSLIWVCTVCSDLSVRKHRVITVNFFNFWTSTHFAGHTLKLKLRCSTIEFKAFKRCLYEQSDLGLHCLPRPENIGSLWHSSYKDHMANIQYSLGLFHQPATPAENCSEPPAIPLTCRPRTHSRSTVVY